MTTNISSYNLSERQVQLDLSVLPYDFEENVKTLSEQARQAWNDVQDLEASACPDNKAQITITMHPSFASQIYFPEEFLLVMGLDCVGVRQVQCFPRDTSSCDTEDGEITVALVCVGKRQDIPNICETTLTRRMGGICGSMMTAVFPPGAMWQAVAVNLWSITTVEDIPDEHKVFAFPRLSVREQMAAYKEIIDSSSLEGYRKISRKGP